MNMYSQTLLLALIGKTNPAIYDALYPHGPRVSEGGRHILASMIVKAISRSIEAPRMAERILAIGQELFDHGRSIVSYDDEDWCPVPFNFPKPQGPHPEPWQETPAIWQSPFFGIEVSLNPQPLPPRVDVQLGALLSMLADAVSIPAAADKMRSVGESLMEMRTEYSEAAIA